MPPNSGQIRGEDGSLSAALGSARFVLRRSVRAALGSGCTLSCGVLAGSLLPLPVRPAWGKGFGRDFFSWHRRHIPGVPRRPSSSAQARVSAILASFSLLPSSLSQCVFLGQVMM